MKYIFLLLLVTNLLPATTPLIETAQVASVANEEQLPLTSSVTKNTTTNRSLGRLETGVALVVLLVVGAVAIFFVRYLKQQGGFRGSRRYLIEHLSTCSVGPKAQVALIKIGKDFALVGVTPERITMLSNCPGLQSQYEQESGLERGLFAEAVQKELTKNTPTLSV